VHEKSLEIRHFRVLTYPKDAELAPSSGPGVARDGNNEKNGSD